MTEFCEGKAPTVSKAAETTKTTESPDAKAHADPLAADFALADYPFYQLSRVNNSYVLDMEAILKTIGMDLPRWRVLMLVHEKTPSGVSEIAERAVIKLSTMTRVIQRMEKEGLVSISTRASDGRITDVSITEAGREAVVKIRGVASRIYNLAVKDFTPAEVESLLDMLRRLFANLRGFPGG
jgi:DNA-binding MarR family transcriptional regulator